MILNKILFHTLIMEDGEKITTNPQLLTFIQTIGDGDLDLFSTTLGIGIGIGDMISTIHSGLIHFSVLLIIMLDLIHGGLTDPVFIHHLIIGDILITMAIMDIIISMVVATAIMEEHLHIVPQGVDL